MAHPSNNTSRPLSLTDNVRSPSHQPTYLNTADSTVVSPPTTTPLQSPYKDPTSSQHSPRTSNRSSFGESLRNYPPSPRAQRTHSFSGAALSELLMNPAIESDEGDEQFKGRDWRTVQVQEIIDQAETRFVELDTSIEDTTKLLIRSGAPNVVLVRESRRTKTALATFGYDDLMAYLLLVLGMSQPDEQAARIAERAGRGETLALKEVTDHLGWKQEPAYLPHTADLMQAVEKLGGGQHRIVVCKEGTTEAIGVLSQLRMVRFFWQHHRNFAAMEKLYSCSLGELGLGAKAVVAINGDKPLADALRLMHDEGITSLPVLDSRNNVVGNISHVDTRLLTDTSAIPLLSSSCIHFISVILSERGVQDGKDSYPVFHVTPSNTLAHTVAKLCATRSHRMWIVDDVSATGSVPASPGPNPHTIPPFSGHHASQPHSMQNTNSHTSAPARQGSGSEPTPGPPFTSTHPGISVSANQNPGAVTSGTLSGVVSLTDVLNVLARASGLSPGDPEESRRRRRGSSSASSRPRGDSVRASGEFLRASGDAGVGAGEGGALVPGRGGEMEFWRLDGVCSNCKVGDQTSDVEAGVSVGLLA